MNKYNASLRTYGAFLMNKDNFLPNEFLIGSNRLSSSPILGFFPISVEEKTPVPTEKGNLEKTISVFHLPDVYWIIY